MVFCFYKRQLLSRLDSTFAYHSHSTKSSCYYIFTMRFFSTIALLVGAASVQAQNITIPPSPGLTFLYTAFVICDTPIQYEAPNGGRQVIPIVGGNFTGPRLSGNSPSCFPVLAYFFPFLSFILHCLTSI
jgi:hypothetical protein